MQKGQ